MSGSVGAFTDRARPPTDDEVRVTLGAALPIWDRLCAFVEASYGPRAEWAILGREYGWMRRFRTSGRTILSLFPGEARVTALVVLPAGAAEEAAGAGLTPRVRAALDGARDYAEGRWVYAPVADAADAASIERLVALRTPATASRRAPGRAGPA